MSKATRDGATPLQHIADQNGHLEVALVQCPKMQLWQQHKLDLEGWHGPHVDEEGREYFANSELGVSSWQDPRQETQHIFEEMLPGYVDTQGELPGFGLLDRRPRGMLEVRGNSFSMDSQPTSPGRSPTPQRSVSSPDLSKKHQQLTAKMEKPEPTFQELRGSLLQTLELCLAHLRIFSESPCLEETFFYIYRDDEESQHLLIQRKLKERRLRRQRLDEEERRKLNQELEEMKRQEEERRQEEEARREAQAAAERAKREAEEQRKREEDRKVEEERQRIHAEEQRRRADAERRAEEARREEARVAEEARLRKELAQSRDGYVLRTAIAEGESVGLNEELAPLRSALAEVGSNGALEFRQRLVSLGDGAVLDDDYSLRTGDIQVVFLSFCSASNEQVAALRDAAIHGRAAEVETILQRPQDPDLVLAHDRHQIPPLMLAAGHGQLEVTRLLLEAKADKDKGDQNGVTPLFNAAYEGQLEVVRLLLEANADKDKALEDGTTPLFIAASEGQLEDKALEDGTTPLFIAASEGQLEVARLLLEANADKDKVDENSATPLFIAAQKGQLEVVRLLLEANADKDKAFEDGATPLFVAAENGQLEVVRLLLEAKADKDKGDQIGVTPLFNAAYEGQLEVVRLLLEANADKDKALEDGTTPLFIAASEGQLEVARLLLEANADKDKVQTRTRPWKMAPPLCSSQLVKDSWRLHGFCWRPMRTRTRPIPDRDKATNDGRTASCRLADPEAVQLCGAEAFFSFANSAGAFEGRSRGQALEEAALAAAALAVAEEAAAARAVGGGSPVGCFVVE
eukprot:s591_g1.t1